MVTLADIRQFKRMQKEYRKLSGMSAIVATGFEPGGYFDDGPGSPWAPPGPITVGALWRYHSQGYTDTDTFWAEVRHRDSKAYSEMQSEMFYEGGQSSGYLPAMRHEGDWLDRWEDYLLGPRSGSGTLSGLGGMKTVDEILIRVRDLEEILGWEMDSLEPDFLSHRGTPRTIELDCKIQALLWAVRFEQHELRTEREILLRIENLREAWHPDIALSYGGTCWPTGAQIEELQWVLRESKPAIVDYPIDPEDLLENDDDGYW